MGEFTANEPNPVLRVKKDGTVLYSHVANEPLLLEWGVKVGAKLPAYIMDFVQRALVQNSPGKIEVYVENRTYSIVFYPLPGEECVNIYRFDKSAQKEKSSETHEINGLCCDKEIGFCTLVENSPDLIVRFDKQNNCLYANLAAVEFYNIPYKEKCNNFYLLVKLSEKLRTKVFTTGKPEAMEFNCISPQGKEYYFDTKIVPEFTNDEIRSVLVFSRDITKIKESEAKLNKTLSNLEKFRNIVELTNEGIGINDSEFKITYANKGMADMLGYTLEEGIGRSIWDFLSEESQTIVKLNLAKKSFRINDGYELKLKRKDGSFIWTHMNTKPRLDIEGKYLGSVSMFTDITKRKEAEEKLRESEQKYRNIIETTNEGIVIIDAEFRITYVNNRLIEKGGYSEEEVIGRSWWDFTDEEGKAAAKMHMDKRQQGVDETYELRLIRKDSSSFWALVSSKSLFDNDCKFIGSLSMLTDITERKKAEEKIKSLANIVESSNDAIKTISPDGTITSWNKGAERIYGYSAEEVLGKNISAFEPNHLKGETKQLADEIKKGKNVKYFETLRLRKNGSTINVSITFSPIIDQYGELMAISCISGDITEKKITEKLHREKKMAEFANSTKSEFLAKISHELRTPLNSIIGFTDMLHEQAYGELNKKQIRVTENISKSGKHLLNLINNLLDISKIESGKMELNYKNFDLPTKINMVRNILSPIADGKNIKIEINIDTKLSNISADEDKFVQIMYNLVNNAIKFSYENSVIKIEARKKGDMVEITVNDTGIGIRIEDQYKLFKPFSQIDSFYSRKAQGTGLGLSLTKHIVHLHKGYVWFSSNPNKGSTFAFAIPININ